MSNNRELGLETLVTVSKQIGINLDVDLLQACFEIQKKHQYSHDRTLSSQAMDKLIEQYVELASGEQTQAEA